MNQEILQGQTAEPLLFLMVDSGDHLTGKTGLTPTVTLSKNGGSFASPSGSVSEIGNGWYEVAGNATDSDTLGPILLHAEASGADPSDTLIKVVAFDPRSAYALADVRKIDNTTARVDVGGSGIVTFLSNATVAVSGDTMRAISYYDPNLDDYANFPSHFTDLVISGGGGVAGGLTAADVWTYGARVLTAGTNIVLAKGTGVTGFNDLDAAGVRSAVGIASANLDTQISGTPAAVWAYGTRSITSGTISAVGTNAITSGSFSVTAQTTLRTQCTTALTALKLDKLLTVAVDPSDVTNDSVFAKLVSASATAVWSDFDNTTDSLQAIRDRGDAAWITATGFASATIAPSWYAAPLDAAGTRSAVGLGSANLDTQLNAIYTVAGLVQSNTDLIPAVPAGVWAYGTRVLTAGTNIVLAKGTGVTGFNDLSAAQVNAEADTALADVGLTSTVTGRIDVVLSTRLPTSSYTDVSSNVSAIKAKTDQLTFTTTNRVDATADKTGYKLASDGLDSINTTAPSGVASNFREMVIQVWRRLFKRTHYDINGGTIKTYADNGTTVLTTQSVTASATDEDVGAAT